MLNKVRARTPIDLPVEKWGRSRGLMVVLGTLVFLFLVIPFLAAFARGLVTFTGAIIVGALSGVVALFLTALFITPR